MSIWTMKQSCFLAIGFAMVVLSTASAEGNEAVASTSGSASAASATPAMLANLVQAERAFEAGEFSKSDALALRCYEDVERFSVAEKGRLFLLRSRLAFAFKRNDEMERWLRELYRNSSAAELSSLIDPPGMFAAWKRVSEEEKAKSQTGNSKQPVAAPQAVVTPQPVATPQAPPSANTQPTGRWDRMVDTYVESEPKLKHNARSTLALFPFGCGHFTYGKVWQGATFLVGEAAFVFLVSGLNESTQERYSIFTQENSTDSERTSDQSNAYSLFGVTGFAGLWGAELLDLMPDIANDSPTVAKWTRFGLSFVPFGVGQIKNGETVKGIGIAGSQAFLLLLSGAASRGSQRELALGLFWGSLVFGMFDGWLNHDWDAKPSRPLAWSLGVAPLLEERGRIAGVQFGFTRQFH